MNEINLREEMMSIYQANNFLCKCAVKGAAAIEKLCSDTPKQKWLREQTKALKRIREENHANN